MTTDATLAGSRVRRDLVHRANDQEILVSPPRQAADGGYVSTTVTTDLSPYYRDHPISHWLDILLLVEACRQAALSAAHEFEGLSHNIAFFFNSIDVELIDPAALASLTAEATVRTDFEQLRLRSDGTPKQIEYAQTVTDATGRPLARTTMAVQGVPKPRYPELRAYQRDGTPAPTTAALRSDAARAGLSTPRSVARTLATNVAIGEAHAEGDLLSALLAPDLSNASLFDHDYDHFPAMVLIEAGRQLAIAGTYQPATQAVTAVRATFEHFAELDRETSVVARRGSHWTDVECVQDGLAVTRLSFAVGPVAPGDGDVS
ncbi:AfsA-related hotdog domain-containing protein [Streptomyces sp. cg35]|uniref:AfsA-related hotdog domain-containing protein n=1 Tax=Streptomyces sp. cg35 TaxID=3421650 RepID=UPI003D16D30E